MWQAEALTLTLTRAIGDPLPHHMQCIGLLLLTVDWQEGRLL